MLNFFAPINDLGYGVFSESLIRAYDRHVSSDVALLPVPFRAEHADPAIERWMANAGGFSRSDPSVMIFQAPFLNRFCGTPMIGLPIFEVEHLPAADVRVLGELDLVLQTSDWGRQVLEGHGLRNVQVVPGGYDPEIFHPDISIEEKLRRIEKEGVTFVHVGKFEARKSSQEILRCFAAATAEGDIRANLIFHALNAFDGAWFETTRAILAGAGFEQSGSTFARKGVRIIVPPERIPGSPRDLYLMADFGIWASKGEGWNLPLLECIACGRPSLTTDNSAQSAFIRRGSYPSELILTTPQHNPTRHGEPWWQIDEDELTGRIKSMLESPRRYLEMEHACQLCVRDFTWENAARRLHEVIAAHSRSTGGGWKRLFARQ